MSHCQCVWHCTFAHTHLDSETCVCLLTLLLFTRITCVYSHHLRFNLATRRECARVCLVYSRVYLGYSTTRRECACVYSCVYSCAFSCVYLVYSCMYLCYSWVYLCYSRVCLGHFPTRTRRRGRIFLLLLIANATYHSICVHTCVSSNICVCVRM